MAPNTPEVIKSLEAMDAAVKRVVCVNASNQTEAQTLQFAARDLRIAAHSKRTGYKERPISGEIVGSGL